MTSFVDSKKRELSQEEIVEIAAKETGGEYTAEQVKASLTAEVYEMGAMVLREGNTLFVVHQNKSNPTVAIFRALNADTIPNYLKNAKKFTEAVGLMGFKYLVTEFKDKSLLSIFEYVRRHPPFKKMGYATQELENDQGYRAIINLGETPRTKIIQEQRAFVSKKGKK